MIDKQKENENKRKERRMKKKNWKREEKKGHREKIYERNNIEWKLKKMTEIMKEWKIQKKQIMGKII